MTFGIEECRELLKQYGQEHVLHFWEKLNDKEQELLLKSISEIDFAKLQKSWTACQEELSGSVVKVDERLQPVPDEVCGSMEHCSEAELNSYYNIGLEQIANNRVACLLLAGGQGTRLGVAHPKGMYKVGLESDKTLYEIQAGRIKTVCRLAASRFGKANCSVPWYIMTSEHTQAETLSFFQDHSFFGLDAKDVRLFEQYTLPTLTLDGKCILESPHHVSVAPDGNGGLYRALAHHGIVEEFKSRGVQYVFVYCVDNILVKMADPHFIGFCVHRNAECANKVVEKTNPKEPVGVVGMLDGRYAVIEYSEITLETASKRRTNPTRSGSNGDPSLLFHAGNICNHFFSAEFLDRVVREHADSLRYHVARKKVPYVDTDGRIVEPEQPNGVKLERFVFDVFPLVREGRFAVWQVRREDEFAPLKNADAPRVTDTPSACRAALHFLHTRQLLLAGASIAFKRSLVSCCNENGTDATHCTDAQSVATSNDTKNCSRNVKWCVIDSDALRDTVALRKLCELNEVAVELDTDVTYFGEALDKACNRLFISPTYIRSLDQ